MSDQQFLLESAKDASKVVTTWADLSNILFDPEAGLVAKAFPNRKDREEFVKTDEYRAIRNLIEEKRKQTGSVEGATPSKSGKFIVRLPKSLHAALDTEAAEEGVSLNQLVVSKLAFRMSLLANGPKPDMALIAQAYLEVRDGYSTDRVVADPEMNRQFLRRCRELGLTGTDFELNWKLFNGRKGSYLKDLPKTKKYTTSQEDEFEFSSEMAIRHVQEVLRRKGLEMPSLDKIICDPDLALEFDEVAERLAPGFSPLEYRWVALGMRKASGNYKSKALEVTVPVFEELGQTTRVKASDVPTQQGMYFFQCEGQPLFIGDTDNLRHRVERHFDASRSIGIPDWLFDPGKKAISLGILPTPTLNTTSRRVAELGAILRHKPYFNYLVSKVA